MSSAARGRRSSSRRPLLRRLSSRRPLLRRLSSRRPVLRAINCAEGPYGASSAIDCAWASTAFGVAVGLMADRVFGEPPDGLHPVRAFGTALTALERHAWRDSRAAGTGYALAGTALGWAVGTALDRGARAAGRPHRAFERAARAAGWPHRTFERADLRAGPDGRCRRSKGPLSAVASATWLVVAGRALGEEARAVGGRLLDDDLDGARRRVTALVGRDPESLDAKGVARATVESVAENTVDAVVAPACWAAIGGAPGAWFYRAVNTLDAMVGHRNERYNRFGWASARLDDAANWIPARLTALLVAAVRPRHAREVLDAVIHPPAHPSPNAGVAEAAFAAALGLRLGGDTVYASRVDPRPAFGSGRSPEPSDIDAAVRLSRDVTLAFALLLAFPLLLHAASRRVALPSRRTSH